MKHRLAALVAAVALPSGSAFADTIVYGSFLPPAHGTNSVVMKEFAETVAQATNGATTIEIVTAGALSGARESLSSVANGALDATPLVYSYTPDDLPAHTFVGEIFTTDHRVAGPAATETILLGCPACRAEARAQGVRILTNPAGGSYHIMCRTSPVVTIGDINGRQMRTSGSNSDLMKSLGGAPVAMAYSEIYEALQRGALDCNLVAATELESSQMWDVTKYVTEISLGNFNSFTSFAINEDRWSALSDPAKSAIIAASAQALATDMNFVSEKIAKVREVAAIRTWRRIRGPRPRPGPSGLRIPGW